MPRNSFIDDIIQDDCLDILERIDLRPFRNKKVLLTGANGLLGSYLTTLIFIANQKKNLNCQLTCVSLHGPNKIVKNLLRDKKIKFSKIDLAKDFDLGQSKFNFIFHAAGYGQPAKFVKDPFSTININVHATSKLLEVTKRSRGRFIFFSSAEIYGNIPKELGAVKEEFEGSISISNPRSVYGESKRMGEVLTLAFRREYGVDAKIVRISHVYGPGGSTNDSRVLFEFIKKGLTKDKIALLDRGEAVKTYGYISDVISMIVYVALNSKDTVYNIGGRDSLSILELARVIGNVCQVPVLVPKRSVRLAYISKDSRYVKLDLTRILKEMKRFKFTSFEKGLARTIDWFRFISKMQ